jgi:ribosome-associated translation inhibitor RaiA
MEQPNKETISLGGNIELNGFQNIEGAKMIVLKKVIGNYVKQMQEKKSDYENLKITLEGDENNATIKAELKAGGSQIATEDTQNNLFVATDNALKKIIEQI